MADFQFGLRGEKGLLSILQSFFLPEYYRAQQRRSPIEEAFNAQAMKPGALFGAAETAANARAAELFKPGGEVATLLGRARGRAIERGVGPEAAQGAELSVLRAAGADVANVFAQRAADLESQRFSALSDRLSREQEAALQLLTSLFTGAASAEQLRLAREQSDIGGARRTLRKIPLIGGIF